MRAALVVAATAALLAAAVPATAEVVDSKFELFVTDTNESARFYAVLGFSVVHTKPDGYATLRSGGTVVALSPLPWWLPLRLVWFLRHPPLGTEIVFYTDDLEAMQAKLLAAGYSPGPVTLQPWGNRDFRLTDPDGYYVRLSEGQAVP